METESKHVKTYYEDLGRESDYILRCDSCKKLVLHADVCSRGGCPKCGNRRVVEVRAMSAWEWFLVWIGIINFPQRKEFLAEFNSRG